MSRPASRRLSLGSDEGAGDLHSLGEADALDLNAGREGALEPARQRGVEQCEDAAVVPPAALAARRPAGAARA